MCEIVGIVFENFRKKLVLAVYFSMYFHIAHLPEC